MSEQTDMLLLRQNQQQQVLDQYRLNIYNLDLRIALLIKMLEEKGSFAEKEFEKRWPMYLQNDIGVAGNDGMMKGSLAVTFYEAE